MNLESSFEKILDKIDSKLRLSSMLYLIIALSTIVAGGGFIIQKFSYYSVKFWLLWILMAAIATFFITLARFGGKHKRKSFLKYIEDLFDSIENRDL